MYNTSLTKGKTNIQIHSLSYVWEKSYVGEVSILIQILLFPLAGIGIFSGYCKSQQCDRQM